MLLLLFFLSFFYFLIKLLNYFLTLFVFCLADLSLQVESEKVSHQKAATIIYCDFLN